MQNAGIKKISTILLSLAILLLIVACLPRNQTRIFLVGDSTMANKPLVDNPEHGWGQVFPLFFTQNVQIFNHAVNGASTKSFINEDDGQSFMINFSQVTMYLFNLAIMMQRKQILRVCSAAP